MFPCKHDCQRFFVTFICKTTLVHLHHFKATKLQRVVSIYAFATVSFLAELRLSLKYGISVLLSRSKNKRAVSFFSILRFDSYVNWQRLKGSFTVPSNKQSTVTLPDSKSNAQWGMLYEKLSWCLLRTRSYARWYPTQFKWCNY